MDYSCPSRESLHNSDQTKQHASNTTQPQIILHSPYDSRISHDDDRFVFAETGSSARFKYATELYSVDVTKRKKRKNQTNNYGKGRICDN